MENEHERRKPLTEVELDAIKTQLLESIYTDIGKSVVKRFLWLLGIVALTAITALSATGHIKFGG